MAINRFITATFLLIFFCCFIGARFKNTLHPYHVGVCQIEWRPKDNSVGLMLKLFSDDFDAICFKRFQVRTNLGMANELKQADEFLQRYLKTHVQLTNNGQLLEWQYLGREQEEDAQWIYIETNPSTNTPSALKLRLTALMDLFTDQVHFVHYKCPTGQQNGRLYLQQPEIVLKCQ
jgi:hypothetical protein